MEDTNNRPIPGSTTTPPAPSPQKPPIIDAIKNFFPGIQSQSLTLILMSMMPIAKLQSGKNRNQSAILNYYIVKTIWRV